MNLSALTLLGLILIVPTFADSYTLYVIEADEPAISERPDLDIPTILSTPGINVTHTLQTEGVPYSPKPVATTPSTDPFADSSSSSKDSNDSARKKVGTRFEVKEEGDQISYSFSEVKEVKLPVANVTQSPAQPIFETFAVESKLTLKPDTFILTGGLHRQESVDDQPLQHLYRWIILVRGSPAKAKIEIPQTPTIISRGGTR